MIKLKSSEKAMMLLSILMLCVLLVLLTTSMIVITSESLNLTGTVEKKTKALQAAEAGVEYAFYQLNSDPNWGVSQTANITEHLSNNQDFTIIFDPLSLYHSKNNLMNKTPAGSTPGYSAEIICKGSYRGVEKLYRAIFARDDVFNYPLYTGGYMYAHIIGIDFSLNAKNGTGDPGRIHSNKDIKFNGNTCTTSQILLDDGFVSTSGQISYYNWDGNQFKTKESVAPVSIADINIPDIISHRPAGCKTIPNNKYYIVGFFEYDPNVPYCVPHALPVSVSWDPNVNTTDYKTGIASVVDTSCVDFLNKYGDFYYSLPPHAPPYAGYPFPILPGRTDRDLFDQYPGAVSFWEYDPNSGSTTCDELGMTMNVTNPTDPNNVMIELSLNEDIYIPTTAGLFESGIIRVNSMGMAGTARYYPGRPDEMLDQSKTKLNLNNYKIYTNKLYLALPPTGRGTIISNETLDFIHAYDTETVIISEKAIRMSYRIPKVNESISYKGVLYAKDYMEIGCNENTIATTGPREFNFYGSVITRNSTYTMENPTLFKPQPLQFWWPWSGGGGINMQIDFETNIFQTDDGLDTLVSLRGQDFRVRKMLCEILK